LGTVTTRCVPVGVILAAGSSSRLGGVPSLSPASLGSRYSRGPSRPSGVQAWSASSSWSATRARTSAIFVARRGLDVERVENDEFGLGNGCSLLMGGRAAAGRFLVAMVDHVIDGEAVTRLLASRAAFALAVDSDSPDRQASPSPQ
jgi:choline kinase